MTPTEPIVSSDPVPPGTVRRIRFVPPADAGKEPLLTFTDPAPHAAVCLAGLMTTEPTSEAAHDGIDILIVSGQPGEQPGSGEELIRWVAETPIPGALPPIPLTVHGAQIVWSRTRAAILAAPDRTEPFFLALVAFSYYEGELRKLEREVSENWPVLEADSALAGPLTTSDPDRFEEIGSRTEQTLKRRMRLVRLVPHLYQPHQHLPPLANQLVERLRERTCVEERHEALVAQLEVFERTYESCSQRISDFTIGAQERTLEWVIIVLLGAEALFLLIDLLWILGA